MRTMKAMGAAGALVVAAIVGGTLMSAALATDDEAPDATGAAATAGDGEYCRTWIDALAGELGVSTDELTAAGRAAAITVIDQAVANGDLTEERAAELEERIGEADGNGCRWLGHGPRFAPPFRHHLPFGTLLDAAADGLGIDADDLGARLRDGETLAEIAAAEGVDITAVTTAITDALGEALDEAVAAGDLTRERADAIADRVAAALADGEWPGPSGPGRGRLHGPAPEDAPAT